MATYCVTALVDFFLLDTVLVDLIESLTVGSPVRVRKVNYSLAIHYGIGVHVWLNEFGMDHVGRQNKLVFVVRSSMKRSIDGRQHSISIDSYSFSSCC